MKSSKFKVKQNLALQIQYLKVIYKEGLPRRLAPPTPRQHLRSFGRGEEVRALWGQSLFEVIFALAVAALVMVGIVSLAASSVRNSTFARNTTLSTRFVQETSEWLRELRDGSPWAVFSAKADSVGIKYCLPSLGLSLPAAGGCAPGIYIAGTTFIREVTLTLSSSDTIDIDIEVRWTDAQGMHKTRSLTQLTSWQTP